MLSLQQTLKTEYPTPSCLTEIPQPVSESTLPLPHHRLRDAPPSFLYYEHYSTRHIIDYDSGTIVYDKLIRPPEPVTTSQGNVFPLLPTHAHHSSPRWSGITQASKLDSSLSSLITPSNSTLRGKAPDLPPLDRHRTLYHRSRGRPLNPGLATLTKKWCHRETQTGDGGRVHRAQVPAQIHTSPIYQK